MSHAPTDRRHRGQIAVAFLEELEKEQRAIAKSAQVQGDGLTAFDAAQRAEQCAEVRRFILREITPNGNAPRYYRTEE